MSNLEIPPLESLLEHRRWVSAVARRLLRDEQAAEDLAQEAWVRAMRSPPDPERDPKPWLRRVLKNLASNMRRGEARRTNRETAWRDSRSERSAAELVADAEEHKRLVGRVLELEEPYKTALLLRFYEALGPKEIAERLGIPVGTVNSRIARAVARLKERLDEDAHGDRKTWIAALLPLAGFDRVLPPVAATATSTSLIGIILMTLSKPNVAVLLVLLLGGLAGGALWLVTDTTAGDRPSQGVLEAAGPDGPSLASRGGRPAVRSDSGLRAERPAKAGESARQVVRGRVLGPDGAVVRGAEILLLPGDSPGLHDEEDATAAMRPALGAEDGAFEVPSRGVEDAQLVVHAPGYMPTSVSLASYRPGAPLELRLGAPWPVTVRVEGPNGTWPVGCSARIQDVLDGGLERAADARRQSFWYALDESNDDTPPERTVAVTTRAPVRVTVTPPRGYAVVPPQHVLEHPQAEAAFRVIPSGHLALRLLDGATGEALDADARGSIWIGKSKESLTMWSVGGRIRSYDFDSRLAPGTYDLEVSAKGFDAWRTQFTVTEVGERTALEARLKRDTGSTEYGRLLLRPIAGETASKALLTMAGAFRKAPPIKGLSRYVVLVRRTAGDLEAWRSTWRGDWAHTHRQVLEDGRLDMSVGLYTQQAPRMPVGTYDVYLAERGTGRAAFVRGVRIFGDQTNEIDVRLEPGTMLRLASLVDRGVSWAQMSVRAGTLGALPSVAFQLDGHSTFTDPVGLRYLLDAPMRDVVLGPFPAPEIEVTLTDKVGATHALRVRGANAKAK